MGTFYPPRKDGWVALTKKSTWNRWEGEQWLGTTEPTLKDRSIVQGLKAQRLPEFSEGKIGDQKGSVRVVDASSVE